MLGQKQPSKGANVLISNKKDYIQLLFIQLIIQMFILSKKGIVELNLNQTTQSLGLSILHPALGCFIYL